MPTEQEIQAYIRLLNPISLTDLPPSDRDCPICFEPYRQPNTPTLHPFFDITNESEYPVRVQSQHPNSACRHAFGRRCIENHFRSGGPWCTRCPTCREEWFEHEDQVGEEEVPALETAREVVLGDGREGVEFVRIVMPRQIQFRVRERPEVVAVQREYEARNATLPPDVDAVASEERRSPVHMPHTPNEEDFDYRGRVNRSIGILEQMLMTAKIDEGDAETNTRVKELERAIDRLLDRLEVRGRERYDAVRTAPAAETEVRRILYA